MSKITYQERKGMRASAFAEPKKRKYPIPDVAHARNAKARVAQHGTPTEQRMVAAEVARRFPSVGRRKRA